MTIAIAIRRGLVIAIILCALVIWFRGSMTSPLSGVRQLGDAPPYHLALLSSRGYDSESGRNHFIEGRVRNISGRSMHNVTVVVTWYDTDGRPQKKSEALIGHNPILPGNTSEFKSITIGSPEMKSFTLAFKTISEGALRVDDRREK